MRLDGLCIVQSFKFLYFSIGFAILIDHLFDNLALFVLLFDPVLLDLLERVEFIAFGLGLHHT